MWDLINYYHKGLISYHYIAYISLQKKISDILNTIGIFFIKKKKPNRYWNYFCQVFSNRDLQNLIFSRTTFLALCQK